MLETKVQEDQASMKTVDANPYAGLKDISEVAPYDSEKDAALFRELHEVLMKHDAAGRFGVTLLHDHFEVGANEWMVETHDPEVRKVNIQPYRNEDLREAKVDLQETNWRFNTDGQPIAFLFCVWDERDRQHKTVVFGQ